MSASQRNTEGEKRNIKEGRIPPAWAQKPAKLRQKGPRRALDRQIHQGQAERGRRPARRFGAATIEASMIWPLIARNPAVASAASKRSNTTSIAGLPAIRARVSASRKVQIVLGVRHRVGQTQAEKPHERQPVPDQSLPRRRPGYSVRSSDRLWLVCKRSAVATIRTA